MGIIAAKYPKNEPILPPSSLRYLSRLSNVVLTPCLIINSLGGTINFALFQRIGILTFFCFVINIVSFLLCDLVGFYIHGEENGNRDSELYITIKIAAGNGNAISLPILVMQILCQDSLINADYNHDSLQCYNEASSMIFVYMIMWFVMFWGYGFPTLQHLKHRQTIPQPSQPLPPHQDKSIFSFPSYSTLASFQVQCIQTIQTGMNPVNQQYMLDKIQRVLLNPAMLAVIVSLCIGFIPPIQQQLFSHSGSLNVIGASIDTIGQPVVALNCLIMAASLAHCDFPVEKIRHYVETFLFEDVHMVTRRGSEEEQEHHAVKNALHVIPRTTSTTQNTIIQGQRNNDIERQQDKNQLALELEIEAEEAETEAEEEENISHIDLPTDGIPRYPAATTIMHHHRRDGYEMIVKEDHTTTDTITTDTDIDFITTTDGITPTFPDEADRSMDLQTLQQHQASLHSLKNTLPSLRSVLALLLSRYVEENKTFFQFFAVD